MWAHAVLDGLQRMDFCTRTTSFVSFQDREETNQVLRNFLKVKTAGGLADDPGREQDIKARYRSYIMEAQAGGEHVSAIWEHGLLEKIDTLYRDCFLTEKPPPPIGTRAWDACMRSYNRSLVSVCDNAWTLLRHAGLNAAEVQASSYALNKLCWMQRLAHDGFAINLPLPTVSFLRQHAYLFSDISVAVRWVSRPHSYRLIVQARAPETTTGPLPIRPCTVSGGHQTLNRLRRPSSCGGSSHVLSPL